VLERATNCNRLRQISNSKSIDRKFFTRTARAAQLPEEVVENTDQIQDQIERQKETIQKYKKKHGKKRETWLEGLAKALAAEHTSSNTDENYKRMQYLKALRQREHQRHSARIIRQAVYADNTYQPLDHTQFDTDDGHLATSTQKEEMEQQLIAENKRRFNQANGSPFLVDPLVTWVGKFGETTGAVNILQHKLEDLNGNVDQFSLMLLEEMQRIYYY
jgi:hypothetical protein